MLAKPSCGTGGPTATGSGSAGGGTYRFSVPASYNPQKAIPLLLALHGDEGKPDYIFSSFQTMQSDSNGAFILVAPRAPFGGGSWYQATSSHETFINAVIAKLLGLYNIDQDRIWVTGWSGGATFLSYYAIKRQDILAAVVFYMGGGGGGSYSPAPNSCKIPCRWVVGTNDFLYSMAKKKYNALTQSGHATVWIDLPGVSHSFQKSTLPGTWSWLQGKTLCNKTIPGSCGPNPPPPPLKHDAGTPPPPPPPRQDGGVGPAPDGAAWPGNPDPPGDNSDALQIRRDGGGHNTGPGQVYGGGLLGGCSVGGEAAIDAVSPLLLLLLIVILRRRPSA